MERETEPKGICACVCVSVKECMRERVCVNYRVSVLTSISKLSEGMLRGMEDNRSTSGLNWSLFKRPGHISLRAELLLYHSKCRLREREKLCSKT